MNDDEDYPTISQALNDWVLKVQESLRKTQFTIAEARQFIEAFQRK